MTHDEELCSEKVVEWCRKHLTKLGQVELPKYGPRQEDIAIAASYSAYDLALAYKGGDPFAAIEWLRTSLDVMERQLLAGKSVQ